MHAKIDSVRGAGGRGRAFASVRGRWRLRSARGRVFRDIAPFDGGGRFLSPSSDRRGVEIQFMIWFMSEGDGGPLFVGRGGGGLRLFGVIHRPKGPYLKTGGRPTDPPTHRAARTTTAPHCFVVTLRTVVCIYSKPLSFVPQCDQISSLILTYQHNFNRYYMFGPVQRTIFNGQNRTVQRINQRDHL